MCTCMSMGHDTMTILPITSYLSDIDRPTYSDGHAHHPPPGRGLGPCLDACTVDPLKPKISSISLSGTIWHKLCILLLLASTVLTNAAHVGGPGDPCSDGCDPLALPGPLDPNHFNTCERSYQPAMLLLANSTV